MRRHIWMLVGAAAVLGSLVARAAPPADSFGAFLQKTGKRVERFWDEFGSVSCVETVSQTKLNPASKVISQKRESYEYLLLLQLSGDQLTVEESRDLQGKAAKQPAKPLLTTGGFSVLALIFHPFYQSSFLFRELPSEHADEQLVGFEAVRGARSPSALELKGKNYPIAWRGVAVIDRASGFLRRIRAGLAAPLEDMGLWELTAEVVYAPIAFHDSPEECWLPQSAVIEARTQKQHWRNRHLFSDYKRFSVNTVVRVGDPN